MIYEVIWLDCWYKYYVKTLFLEDEWERCTGGSSCCLNYLKNGKYPPLGKYRLCAKSVIYFNWIKCLFCHFLGRELFLFFQYVYSADFCRELNLQISCIFVAFDIKKISNVAHATFCKVFLLYTNYAILYILYSIHQKPQYLVSIPIVQ